MASNQGSTPPGDWRPAHIQSSFTDNRVSGNARVHFGHVFGNVTHNHNATNDLLGKINAPNVNADQYTAHYKHVSGTGDWLLWSRKYYKWYHGSTRHLWLHGMAGCGKTILCSSVIDDIRKICKPCDLCAVVFFYFSFADKEKQSYDNLIRSAFTQLARTHIGQEVINQSLGQEYPHDVDVFRMESTFALIVEAHYQVYFCVDALDECPEDQDARSKMLDCIARMAERSPKLKFFLTSRDLPIIAQAMNDIAATRVPVAGHQVDRDIAIYVESVLSSDRRFRALEQDTRALIRYTLSSKAHGMFRWAVCQLQDLKKLRITTRKNVEHHLSNLPRDLDETYERMLTNLCALSECDQQAAITVLAMLLVGYRPMYIDELADACIVNPFNRPLGDTIERPTEDELVDLLAELVVVREHSVKRGTRMRKRLEFAHFSVPEYLVSGRVSHSVSRFAIDDTEAHRLVAQSCMHYLEYMGDAADFWGFPLAKYAALHWHKHGRICGLDVLSSEMRLLDSEPWVRIWQTTSKVDDFGVDDTAPIASGLYCASYLGLHFIVQALCVQGNDVNSAKGGKLGTALHAAVKRGHADIVQLLLENGADCNSAIGVGWTPLQLAAHWGYEGIVKTLLDHGAHPNPLTTTESLLLIVLRKGNLDIFRMLLDAGTNLKASSSRNENVDSSLQMTAGGIDGRPDPGRLLLDEKAATNCESVSLEALLQTAIRRDATLAIHMLLDAHANPNALDDDGKAPLHLVAERRPIKPKNFLARSFSPEAMLITPPDWEFEPELEKVSEGLAVALLNSGADVNVLDRDLRTPLLLACGSGNARVLRTLLYYGAKKDVRDRSGNSALHIAVRTPSVQILRCVLSFDASLNDRDDFGRPALHIAASHKFGCVTPLLLLLDAGADLQVLDERGRSALHHAAESGVVVNMAVLINRGINVNLLDDQGSSPLHIAVEQGRIECVIALLEHGADVHARDIEGREPLSLAAASRESHDTLLDMIAALLKAGASINASDNDDITFLHEVARRGTVELFLWSCKHGADLTMKDCRGETAVALAERRWPWRQDLWENDLLDQVSGS